MAKNGNGKPWAIEVDCDALIGALALVGTAIDRRSTIPILTHVLCRVEAAGRGGEILTLIGSNLDQRVEHRVRCDSAKHQEGEFTLPWFGLGKALSSLAGSFSGNGLRTIRLEVDLKNLKAQIIDRTTTLSYETLPPADFPVMENVKAKASGIYTVTAEHLKHLIEHVRHAISNEATRFYLNGAYFHCIENGVLRLVTTDGHRMVVDQIPAKTITPDVPKIIVPTDALNAVSKHCAAAPSAMIEIASHSNGVSFDFGLGRVISSKTIDGSFPDYTRVIPTKNDKTVLLNANELDAALAKFPASGSRSQRSQSSVKLTFKKNNLTLSRVGIEGKPGVTLKVPCEWEEPEFGIGFNPSYLRDALRVLGDTVGFAFDDAGSPALVMSDEYPQIILMPMRV
jgi:DNA polymerase-3 subunit beta